MIKETLAGKWVVFTLGRESYAVLIEHVMTIETMKPVTRMPEMPQHILGMINLRGEVFPVISVRERMGLEPQEASDQTRIMVLQFEGHLLGCVVDSVTQVVTLTEEIIQPPPILLGDTVASAVRGIAKLENQLVILVDHRHLMTLV